MDLDPGKRGIGSNVISLETVDSTNAFAVELGERQAAHGTVVVAEKQTKGRGRLGRTWASPSGGNIYMSVLLRPSVRLEDVTILTVMAGVACVRALRDATGVPVAIKWPNDLMVDGKKLGGILTEIKSASGRVSFAAVGIGINVNADFGNFPPDIRDLATSLKIETGVRYPKNSLITGILKEMGHWYDILLKTGKRPLIEAWRSFSPMLGRQVRVVMINSETLTGIAQDITDEGMLLVRLPSGAVKTISAGDLTVLR